MLIGALLKYMVYKISWAMYSYIITWIESSISKDFSWKYFFYICEKRLCLSKADESIYLLNFSGPIVSQ